MSDILSDLHALFETREYQLQCEIEDLQFDLDDACHEKDSTSSELEEMAEKYSDLQDSIENLHRDLKHERITDPYVVEEILKGLLS